MAVDLIVIPRCCSSSLVSVKRASPALAAEIIPARWTSESVRVDFPWSTWLRYVSVILDMLKRFATYAITEIFLMLDTIESC